MQVHITQSPELLLRSLRVNESSNMHWQQNYLFHPVAHYSCFFILRLLKMRSTMQVYCGHTVLRLHFFFLQYVCDCVIMSQHQTLTHYWVNSFNNVVIYFLSVCVSLHIVSLTYDSQRSLRYHIHWLLHLYGNSSLFSSFRNLAVICFMKSTQLDLNMHVIKATLCLADYIHNKTCTPAWGMCNLPP